MLSAIVSALRHAMGRSPAAQAAAGSGASSSMGSLLAAARQAGDALDALARLKQADAQLLELGLMRPGGQRASPSSAELKASSTSSSQGHVGPATGSLLQRLQLLQDQAPPALLDRLTRFALEEGMGHIVRGFAPSTSPSSEPALREHDPFGILMVGVEYRMVWAFGSQHVGGCGMEPCAAQSTNPEPNHRLHTQGVRQGRAGMRPMGWHEYLASAEQLAAHAAPVLRQAALAQLLQYCRLRRELVRAWMMQLATQASAGSRAQGEGGQGRAGEAARSALAPEVSEKRDLFISSTSS